MADNTTDAIRSSGEEIRAAQFAFFGVVRAIGQSNVREVPSDENVSVVTVEELVFAPASLGDITGRDLTLRTTRGQLKEGERALFLGSSWVYGEEIAIVEVRRISGELDRKTAASELTRARLGHLDDELIARIRGAEHVIRGRVVSVRPFADIADRPGPTREGGDDDERSWRAAEVTVLEVAKGDPGAEVIVIFPYPRSPRWVDAPEFFAGQDGVWLLWRLARIRRRELPKSRRRNLYASLHLLDFHAPGEFRRIHTLALASPEGAS